MKPKLFNAEQNAETREHIHAEVRDWFPTAESLAQQLGTDARRLAQSYPAPNTAVLLAQMRREQAAAETPALASLLGESSPPGLSIAALDESQSEENTATRKIRRRIAGPFPQVAAAAALLVIACWSVWRWSAGLPLAPDRDLAEQPHDSAIIPVVYPSVPLAPQEFQTLSAPEREAVLDLLEEQALGTVSLSI